MGQTETTRQSDEILPPIEGSICNFAVTSTPLLVDLTTFPQSAALPSSTVKGSEHLNPLGQYLTFIADADVFVMFTSASGDVAAMTTTDTVTVTAGVITPNNKCTFRLPAGQAMHFRLPPGPTVDPTTGRTVKWGADSFARFLGVMTASGSTVLRSHVSSR